MAFLPPIAQPIAIFPNLIARGPETLVLKEKILSLSGDSFDIALTSGQPILRVTGNAFSFSDRKNMLDLTNGGVPLFDIRKKLLGLHTTYYLEQDGKQILEVRYSFKLIGSKARASFTSLSGKPVSLVMEGKWLNNHVAIVDENTGATVARINRQMFNGRQIFGGQQTYAVEVATGVDMALIAALCICLDEKAHEN